MTPLRPIHTIRLKDPALGSESLEAGVQTVRFQGSICVVRMSEGHLYCVHTIRFPELTKNLQFGAKTITGISCIICRRLSSFNKSVGWKQSMFYFHPFLFQNYGSVCWKVIFNVFTRSDFRNQQKSDPKKRIV